jgi:hypothetical protein
MRSLSTNSDSSRKKSEAQIAPLHKLAETEVRYEQSKCTRQTHGEIWVNERDSDRKLNRL